MLTLGQPRPRLGQLFGRFGKTHILEIAGRFLFASVKDQSIGRPLDLSVIYNLRKMFRRAFFILGDFVKSRAGVVGFLNLKRRVGSDPSIVSSLIQGLVRIGLLLKLLESWVSRIESPKNEYNVPLALQG